MWVFPYERFHLLTRTNPGSYGSPNLSGGERRSSALEESRNRRRSGCDNIAQEDLEAGAAAMRIFEQARSATRKEPPSTPKRSSPSSARSQSSKEEHDRDESPSDSVKMERNLEERQRNIGKILTAFGFGNQNKTLTRFHPKVHSHIFIFTPVEISHGLQKKATGNV